MDCLHREVPDFKRKTGDDKVSGPNWVFEGIPPYHRSRRTRRRPRPVASSRRSSSPLPSEMARARKILSRIGSISRGTVSANVQKNFSSVSSPGSSLRSGWQLGTEESW